MTQEVSPVRPGCPSYAFRFVECFTPIVKVTHLGLTWAETLSLRDELRTDTRKVLRVSVSWPNGCPLFAPVCDNYVGAQPGISFATNA